MTVNDPLYPSWKPASGLSPPPLAPYIPEVLRDLVVDLPGGLGVEQVQLGHALLGAQVDTQAQRELVVEDAAAL